jgi:hypothetical protein
MAGPSTNDAAIAKAPWSVSWSGEQAFRLQPSRDFPGLIELDQKQAPGEGEPMFAMMHIARQRRAVIDQLCHVCGRPTPKHDRWIFPVASGGLVTLHDGTQQYGCNVPPIHKACTERAAAECPHLSRLQETPLKVVGDEGRVIHRTDITPGLEPLAKTLPPGLEVVFSCYRLYGPAFTRRVIVAREEWDAEAKRRRSARGE